MPHGQREMIKIMADDKKLISLEEANKAAIDNYWKKNPPAQNGIACPVCGEELWDSNPGHQYFTTPPQIATECRKCSFRSTRYA